MPIRLNLLAEAQAAEELRRRDPVKRFIWLAALLVVAMLVWSSTIQLKVILSRSDVSQLEAKVAGVTNEYTSVLEEQSRATDTRKKIGALYSLATNRLLNASLLNALQASTVDHVQLTRLKIDQGYAYTPEVKGRTNSGRITPGKPAVITERTLITLDARDASPNPGDQVSRLRVAVATNDYFVTLMGRTNEVQLTKLSPPQGVPGESMFVTFTLECRLPDKTR